MFIKYSSRFVSIVFLNLVLLNAISAHGQILSFSPITVVNNAVPDNGNDQSPSIATNGKGTWIAVWHSDEDLNGTAGTDNDIFIAQSSDDGLNWSNPILLTAYATSDVGEDRFPVIAYDTAGAGGRGTWIIVWQSTHDLLGATGTDTDILFVFSGTNGSSWSAPNWLNSNAPADSGTEFAPAIAVANGTTIVSWDSDGSLEDTIGTDLDIVYARSTNGGINWETHAPLNTNAASDTSADIEVDLEGDGNGNWVAVWQTNFDFGGTAGTDVDIAVATSADDGMTWSAPAPLNSSANADIGTDSLANIAYDGDSNWVVAWGSTEDLNGTAGIDSDIYSSYSTNNGATWSPMSPVEADPLSNTGTDVRPVIESDGANRFFLAWHSTDDLGGTANADNDIFFSLSTNFGQEWLGTFVFDRDFGASNNLPDFNVAMATDRNGIWRFVWQSQDFPSSRGGVSNFNILSALADFSFPSALSVPFFLDNASNYVGGQIPDDGTASFIGIKNAFSQPIDISVTYTDTEGNDRTPLNNSYTIPANSMVSWRPFADDPIEGPAAGQLVPNATGDIPWGSALIESNLPITGRLIHVDGRLGTTALMVLPENSGATRLTVPFYLDNASNFNGGTPATDGTSTFIGIKNTSAKPVTLTLFYTDTTGTDHTPVENTYLLQGNSMVSWRPFADDPAEGDTAGRLVPNTSGGPSFGSVEIRANGPITGRMITIDGAQGSTGLMVLPIQEVNTLNARSVGSLENGLTPEELLEQVRARRANDPPSGSTSTYLPDYQTDSAMLREMYRLKLK